MCHKDLFVVKKLVYRLIPLFLTILFVFGDTALAQTTRNTNDGFTPVDVAPGSPSGSYTLTGFDTVNLFSGKMNFQLPLIGIGGRGAASFTISLPIEQRWNVVRTEYSPGVYSDSAEPLGQGFGAVNRYGPGYLIGEKNSSPDYSSSGIPCNGATYVTTITRLKFVSANGTEHQLHDKLNNGVPYNYNICPNPSFAYNRGKVFVSADGESITFISDSSISDQYGQTSFNPSGILLLSNGTRYRIDNGQVTWIRDRNGNKVTFTHGTWGVTSVTDSLNRQISISYTTQSNSYDTITYSGFGGATRQIKIWYTSMQQALRPDYSIQTTAQLFPEYPFQANFTYNPTVVSRVELPDMRNYQFYYNSYGELARVILPTGGGYDYNFSGENSSGSGAYDLIIKRRLMKRTTYKTLSATTNPLTPPSGSVEKKEIYTASYSTGGSSWRAVTVEQKNEGNTLLAQEKHTFYDANELICDTTSYAPWWEGKEYKTEFFAVTNGVLGSALRKTEQTWYPSTSGGGANCIGGPAPAPKVSETITTLVDNNQVTKSSAINPANGSLGFDQYNNQTDVWEYDYGTGTPGALLRHTHTDFLTAGYDSISGGTSNPDATNTIHLRNLPTQQTVYNASGTAVAQTSYEYDNYDSSTGHAPLVNRSNISALVSRNGQTQAGGYAATNDLSRGNVTKTTRYLLNSSGAITGSVNSYAQYDIAGNVVKTIDANGNATNLEFNDRFGAPNGEAQSNTNPSELANAGQSSFAFPTKVTNALNHSAYMQLDYYTGKPVDTEDANNVKASLYYNDVLDRLTKGIRAVGTSLQNQTVITYDDTNKTISTATDKDTNTDGILQSMALYDGLGRTYRKAAFEGGSNWSIVETQFDALGRAYRSSNPFRDSAPTAALPADPQWTISTFDALSRVTQVTMPDGAVVTTAYDGNVVTVTDQAGKQRRSLTDAHGRLQRVDEPSGCNSCLGSVSAPSQPTGYSYDVLDNLTTVTQTDAVTNVTQTRTFAYNSLKRLTAATNPESGTTNYAYDNNGNLATKTDAMGRSLTYYYDALNRSQGFISNQSNTWQVAHYYDGATNGKGKLHYSLTFDYYFGGSTQNAKSLNVIPSYDALGRPQRNDQYFRNAANNDWMGYSTLRTYDLASNVKSQTYPSGRVVNYDYNTAGQMTTFKGNLGDGTNRVYASEMAYNAAGQMLKEAWGKPVAGYSGMTTPLYQNKHYNNRLQMYDIRLGTSSTDEWTWNRGALRMFYDSNFAYGNGGTNNNGNVYRMDHFVPGDDNVSSWTMSLDYYQYDALNRITGIWENKQSNTMGETSTGLTQQYVYDRFGNRTVNNAVSNFPGVFNTGMKIDQTTNRLKAITDSNTDNANDLMRYDAVGNQWKDNYTGAGARTYDANNKLITAAASGGGTVSYSYNANASRVTKTIGSTTTWYIYGLGGELVAEYPQYGTPSTPQIEYGYRGAELLIEGGCDDVRWRLTDHLGSTRMSVGVAGSLASVKRTDYIPFGEEIGANVGIRTTTQGYSQTDCWRQKFTGYERDAETGLDYAQARMFSGAQGRFTSVDPLLASGRPWIPQSWNRYSYAINRPLGLIDPSGLEDEEPDSQKGKTSPSTQVKVLPTEIRPYEAQGENFNDAQKDAVNQASKNGISQTGCLNPTGCVGQTSATSEIDFTAKVKGVTNKNGEYQVDVSLTNVAITVQPIVQLPVWAGYDKAPEEEKNKWDNYIAGVKDHEEGHVRITGDNYKQAAQEADKAAIGPFRGTGKTGEQARDAGGEAGRVAINNAVGKKLDALEANHKAYDTRTLNGKIPR